MTDRFRPNNQPNAPRSRVAAPNAPQPAIRRNLFQNGGGANARAARRPVPVSAESAETVIAAETSDHDTSEIVVRDRHGEVEIGDLEAPQFDETSEGDDEGKQEMERMFDEI